MDYITIFAVSFSIALSGALMPGPLLTCVISESTKSGFKAGPLIILGHALLEVLMIALIIFGLAPVLSDRLATTWIFLLGAGILIYFGAGMLLSLRGLRLDFNTRPQKSMNLALLGITMSISNPYWSIWWLTIGLGLVLGAKKEGLTAVTVFFLGHILADLGWYSIVSLAISKGRKFISERAYKITLAVCGLALIGFGLYFGIKIIPG